MRLVPRLVLLGGGLPLLGVVLAIVIAGSLFRRSLLDDLDQRLLAQAAVESVSMFDGPEGRPHLHMLASSLADEVAAFAPSTTVFDPEGHVVLSTLDEPPSIPEGVSWVEAAGEPEQMRFASVDGVRALIVRLVRPEGDYTLVLTGSLEPIDNTMSAFYRDVLGTVAAIWAVLLLVLFLQGRRIVGRIEALRRLAPAIREGRRAPVVDVGGGDELHELSVVLRDAADTLAEVHDAQERFLASAAHQLRTPISLLRTEVDLALRKPRDAAQLREALTMVREHAEHLGSLAARLLDFESLRSAPLDRHPQPMLELVDAVLERHATGAAKRGVRLLARDDGAVVAGVDRMLVEQAVENLVDNAIRFAPEGTAVEVVIEERDGRASVMVYDEGRGFEPAARERLFQPFAPGTGEGAQTGLGLAFVAEIARKHGGRPRLETAGRNGVGFELPLD